VPDTKNVAYGEVYGQLPISTRTGYDFAGWYTGDNGTDMLVTYSTLVTNSAPHTLYAKWTGKTYTVTYDAENGTVNPASESVTFAAAYGTLATPTRTGYTFAGWWTGDNGTGTEVINSTTVTNLQTIRYTPSGL